VAGILDSTTANSSQKRPDNVLNFSGAEYCAIFPLR
jgi:hypothetical protein